MRRSSRGAFYGIGAAALFGVSTPLAKHLVGQVRPQLLAGLLYGGAAIVLSLSMIARRSQREARLRGSDAPSLVAVITFGGIVAPVLLLVGLERVTGIAGSLLLNLEAVFTMLLALSLFGEHIDRRAAVGATAIVGAAVILGLGAGRSTADWIGIACIALACVAWAVDNNLTQRLSDRDPFAIVRAKAAVAGAVNVVLALVLGSHWPPAPIVLGGLALGGAAYGLSVVLDAYALRFAGAAREAAYFATAPAFGVIGAMVFLGESSTAAEAAAIVATALGVYLLVTERHAHLHQHEPLEHEHRHRHDDGHHDHHHDEPVVEHSHPHVHAAVVHSHGHVSDLHHRHRHGP